MSTAEDSRAVPSTGSPGVPARTRTDWLLFLSAVCWGVLVVNFAALQLKGGDESVQYRFVERLFGDAPHALGYYFGLGLVEAPFYALGKGLDRVGIHQLYGHPIRPAVVGLGLGLLTLVAWPLLGRVIKGLELRYAGFVILAAGLGTPLFYYSSFLPGKNHALDATLFTAVVYLVFRYFRAGDAVGWSLPVVLGVVLGFSYTVRYFSGAEGVTLVVVLAYFRRWRHAAQIGLASAVTCVALFAIPRSVHVAIFAGGYKPDAVLTFAPLNPLRMLFTNHRGMFVWSPVTALALVGIVLLFQRRPQHRPFLVAVLAMALAIMASYALVAFWDGTWAFGQRFYTPLFPLVVIGLAGLMDAVPRVAAPAIVVAVAWTVFLMFNFTLVGGPQYVNTTPGGATDLARLPIRTHVSIGAYLWGMKHRSNLLHAP